MSYFRRPRTTQERRASQDGYGRKSRNLHNLPNAWDDLMKGKAQRSWKSHRKNQYKIKNIVNESHIIHHE